MQACCSLDNVFLVSTDIFNSACTNSINDAVVALPSVQEVSISLLNNSMNVTYDENGISSQQLIELIEDLGFEGTEWETAAEEPEKPASTGERVVQIQFGGIANKYVRPTLH